MMPAKLTDEQKLHLKAAHRSQERIQETWSLFTLYLGEGKPPQEALRLAREAVAVWVEFQDSEEIEPPEIEPPDFLEQMGKIADKLAGAPNARMSAIPDGFVLIAEDKDKAKTPEPEIDAEFAPPAE